MWKDFDLVWRAVYGGVLGVGAVLVSMVLKYGRGPVLHGFGLFKESVPV